MKKSIAIAMDFLEVTVRTSRIVAVYRLDAPLSLDSACSLLYGEKLRRKRYSIVFVSFSDSNRRTSASGSILWSTAPNKKPADFFVWLVLTKKMPQNYFKISLRSSIFLFAISVLYGFFSSSVRILGHSKYSRHSSIAFP